MTRPDDAGDSDSPGDVPRSLSGPWRTTGAVVLGALAGEGILPLLAFLADANLSWELPGTPWASRILGPVIGGGAAWWWSRHGMPPAARMGALWLSALAALGMTAAIAAAAVTNVDPLTGTELVEMAGLLVIVLHVPAAIGCILAVALFDILPERRVR